MKSYRLLRALCAVVALCTIAIGVAPPAVAQPSDASSSRTAREEAVRAIPWNQIAPQHRQAAQTVVQHASVYRRLPTRVIDCDPDMFTFLLRHPEVVIDTWHVMGLSRVKLDQRPDGSFVGADGAGTVGNVRYLHANWGRDAHNSAVIFADGSYEGPPFVKPLKAQSIILLRSGSVQETNGRYYVTVRVDSFIRIEQVGLDLLAKTVQPWIAKTADQNLIETLGFVSNFSRTAEQNPQGIERLATRLSSTDGPTRAELVTLSFRTAERYARVAPAGPPNGAIVARRAPSTNAATR